MSATRNKGSALKFFSGVKEVLSEGPTVPPSHALKVIVSFLESLNFRVESTPDPGCFVWRRSIAPPELEIVVLSRFQSLGFEFVLSGRANPPEFSAICHSNYPAFGGIITVSIRRLRNNSVLVKIAR